MAAVTSTGSESTARHPSERPAPPAQSAAATAPTATRTPTPNRLADAFTDRRNALGTIRLVLALTVVASHSFFVLRLETELTQLAGAWAVNGFFALSGYLIAGSKLRLPLGRYLWHRGLRLMPAFWVVLIAVAFIAAPLSTLADGAQWQPLSAISYVVSNAGLVVTQHGVDDTLRSVPALIQWNAPLWTLAHEATAYVIAGLALSLGFVRRRQVLWLSVAMAGFMVANVVGFTPLGESLPIPFVALHGIRLGGFFVAGMLLFALRKHVPLR